MGIRCPRCSRHTHAEVIEQDKKTKKRYAIDRCAFTSCNYNFDIVEIKLEPKEEKNLEPKHNPKTDNIRPDRHLWRDIP